jgi:hypothetical protein
VTKNTKLTPDKIEKIETVLEERKTKRDRRSKLDPTTAPKADRRTGRDRRDED